MKRGACHLFCSTSTNKCFEKISPQSKCCFSCSFSLLRYRGKVRIIQLDTLRWPYYSTIVKGSGEWCNRMWSISIYLQRVSSRLKVAAENVTVPPNCSQETRFWRKGNGYVQPCRWHTGYFCFTCKSHPQFSSSLCRKSQSTVMKYMPLYTVPISWHALNDSMLNTSPTGYQRSHFRAVLGDVLLPPWISKKESLGRPAAWASGPARDIHSVAQSKMPMTSVLSLQLLKIPEKCVSGFVRRRFRFL